MFSFFPKKQETRLVTIPAKLFYKNLEKYIKPLNSDRVSDLRDDYIFNGLWDQDGFSISLILKISNNFIPIVKGDVLSSDAGILVKLTYEFFPSTKRLLLLWTILTILITVFFIGIYQAWMYGAISLGFCVVNYIFSRENFKIQVRKSERMIEKLFSYTEDFT